MALQRHNSSAGASPRPTPRPANLIALRYEETVQAEPPVMIPARGSAAYLARSRSTRSLAPSTPAVEPASTSSPSSPSAPSATYASSLPSLASPPTSPAVAQLSSPTISPLPSPTPSTAASFSSFSSLSSLSSLSPASSPSPRRTAPFIPRSPLVILRPPGLATPPAEQHPALRGPSFRPIAEEEAGEGDVVVVGETGSTSVQDQDSKDAAAAAPIPVRSDKRDSILASAAASTITLDGKEGKQEQASGEEAEKEGAPAKESKPPSSPETKTPSSPSTTPTTTTTTTSADAPVREKSWRLPRSFSFRSAGSLQRRKSSKISKQQQQQLQQQQLQQEQSAGVESGDVAAGRESTASSSASSSSSRYSTSTTNTNATPADNIPCHDTTSTPVAPRVAHVAHVAQEQPQRGDTKPAAHSTRNMFFPAVRRRRSTASAGVAASSKSTTMPVPSAPMPIVLSTVSGGGPILPPLTARSGAQQCPRPEASWAPLLAGPLDAAHPAHSAHSAPPVPQTQQQPALGAAAAAAPPPLFRASSFSPSSRPPFSPSSSFSSTTHSTSTAATTPTSPRFLLRVLSMSDVRHRRQAGSQSTSPLSAATPTIDTTIPTERLLEDDFLQSLTFSKRGSVMLAGKLVGGEGEGEGEDGPEGGETGEPSATSPSPLPAMPRLRQLAPAIERESLQVRSLYASSSGLLRWEDGRPPQALSVAAVRDKSPPRIPEEAEPAGDGGSGANDDDGEQTRNAAASVSSSIQTQETQETHETHGTSETSETPADAIRPAESAAETHTPTPTLAVPLRERRPKSASDGEAARASVVSAVSAVSTKSGTSASTLRIALSETESSLSAATPQPTNIDLEEPAAGPVPDIVLAPVAGAVPDVAPEAVPRDLDPGPGPLSHPGLPKKAVADRDEFELAGGLEDWADVNVADVDRFGFIHARRPHTSAAESAAAAQTAGQTAEQTADKSGGLARRFSHRHRLAPHHRHLHSASRSVQTSRSTSTATTAAVAAAAAARSSLRAAANQLPYNRERRWIDEAGGMLTLEPGLADIAEDEDAGHLAEALKRKEWERAEKWRRMATVVQRGSNKGGETAGGGMDFSFDLRHPKLAERTWKGIPDRWRAPAWYSFLASSAEKRRLLRRPAGPGESPGESAPNPAFSVGGGATDGGETDGQIVAAFHALQATASPDDVQIDLDVPRTVGGHVLFRRRYRGGQRLLFRVLHALSLYFPDTGYVQGMASLAATLLCYYDEERCFVMLVRLFHLRGLARLYAAGFGGLMAALGAFEQQWLARSNRRVAAKLAALGIDAPTYATRWYLTVFNLSVPFAAQLRIWDVFMLLGGEEEEEEDGADELRPGTRAGSRLGTRLGRPGTSKGVVTVGAGAAGPSEASAKVSAKAPEQAPEQADAPAKPPHLDILHATSTALIDGLQEVLLDADFENAMKAVTSWVPIKDEELLMKVVQAEWKRHQKRRR